MAQNTLLREQIREGFVDTRRVLDSHTEQITDLKLGFARMDTRTTALEAFRNAQEATREARAERAEANAGTTERAAIQLSVYQGLGAGLLGILSCIAVLAGLGVFG